MNDFPPTRVLEVAYQLLKTEPHRSKLLGGSGTVTNDPGKTKTYANYLAAIGPSLRQMGLLPTLEIYANEGGGGDQPKRPLQNYLQAILAAEPAGLYPAEEGKEVAKAESLLTYAKTRGKDSHRLRRRLETTVRAAKLIFKTYNHGHGNG